MSDFFNHSNALLDPKQREALSRVLDTLSPTQLAWLAGFISARAGAVQSIASQAEIPSKKLVVLYGSQTGNAEGVAELAATRAKERGFEAKAVSMNDYNASALKKEENVFVVGEHPRGRRST